MRPSVIKDSDVEKDRFSENMSLIPARMLTPPSIKKIGKVCLSIVWQRIQGQV
jgi:hypothetical protein